jgi:hypothetical protein
MSVSAFNPAANAATNAYPTANALPSANVAPAANVAMPTDTFTSNAAAPAANTVMPTANAYAPAANTGIEGLPSVEAPAANTAMPTDNYAAAPTANAPTANAPAYNQAPTANTAVSAPAPAPVQAKSAGGFLGSILAAAGGGLLALKGIVPKFFPALLQNASKLKMGGIFGVGALAGSLLFGLFKSKLSAPAPAPAAASANGAPTANAPMSADEAIAQVKALLAQGVPPQELMQAGVPAEVLRQLGAQV